jgi:hypothetical protein
VKPGNQFGQAGRNLAEASVSIEWFMKQDVNEASWNLVVHGRKYSHVHVALELCDGNEMPIGLGVVRRGPVEKMCHHLIIQSSTLEICQRPSTSTSSTDECMKSCDESISAYSTSPSFQITAYLRTPIAQ